MENGESDCRRFIRRLTALGAAGGIGALLFGRVSENPLMPLAPAASGDYLYKDFVNTGTGTTELDSSGSEVALKVMATASSGYSTAPQGDLTFENGVRAKEEADGLVFMNPQGTKIALLDAQGNFHIKGDIIKDL